MDVSKIVMIMGSCAFVNGMVAMEKPASIGGFEHFAKMESAELKSFIDKSFPGGLKLLHEVVRKGNFELVEKLLAIRADPNARDAEGRTPLYFLCARRAAYVDIAAILLFYGAQLDVVDRKGDKFVDSPLNGGVAKIILSRLILRPCNKKGFPWWPINKDACTYCGGLTREKCFEESFKLRASRACTLGLKFDECFKDIGELRAFSCGHKIHIYHIGDFKPDAVGDCFDCYTDRMDAASKSK